MKKIIYFLLCILLFTSMFATSVFAYSPQKAITYSNTYAINPNKMNTLGVGYNVYSRDCTNFVSQCLYAGGLSQDSTWKSIPNWHGNTVVRVDSTQWVNANSLKEYSKGSERFVTSKDFDTSPCTSHKVSDAPSGTVSQEISAGSI
mgnify:CR=1 FL=1